MTLPEAERLACGVDIVDVAAIARSVQLTGGRFAEVCFTEGELRDARGFPERLASRWAVKEAVCKALGCGLLRGVGLQDIEVIRNSEGALSLRLLHEARRIAVTKGLSNWAVSMTHDRGCAIAFVVAT